MKTAEFDKIFDSMMENERKFLEENQTEKNEHGVYTKVYSLTLIYMNISNG